MGGAGDGPADLLGTGHTGSEFDEVGFGGSSFRKRFERREGLRNIRGVGKRRGYAGLQSIVQTLAGNRPRSQVFRAGPNQAQTICGKLADGNCGCLQEFVGARDFLFGEDKQELLRTAGTQQHSREF